MEKKFSPIQIATLRNVAKLIYPLQEKIDAFNVKIGSIVKEIHELDKQITTWNKPIFDMFGHNAINLIKKEKIDKRTVYTLRYPETIVPVETNDNDTETSESVTEETESEEVGQTPEANVFESIPEVEEQEVEEQEVEEQEVEEQENPFENPPEEEAQENSEEEVFY